MPTSALLLRPSTPDDLPAVTAIYAWNVLNGTSTFELEAPDLAEMTRRHADLVSKDLPWLVAERNKEVLGFAYATISGRAELIGSAWKTRSTSRLRPPDKA